MEFIPIHQKPNFLLNRHGRRVKASILTPYKALAAKLKAEETDRAYTNKMQRHNAILRRAAKVRSATYKRKGFVNNPMYR